MHRHLPFIIAAALLTALPAPAQETPSRHAVPGHVYLKEYWGRPGLYLEHQARYMLDLADRALTANPPALEVNLEREEALLLTDAVLHEPAPMENPAVLDFLARRTARVAADLERPLKGRRSLRVYKIYNCGILFRTRDLTVAVDLNGRDGKLISDEAMEQVLDHVDVLFYTHNHFDHADHHVRDICHRKGIPVYTTDEIFPEDGAVRHVWADTPQRFEVDLPAGRLTVDVLPGHQDLVHNNIWVVTLPNGKVVCAMGDQWQDGKEDLVWLKDIYKALPAVDVLAMDCWIHDYDEHVSCFRPRLIISQHENEIGAHGIDHREAFWMTLYKNRNFHATGVPWVLMAWGEWYDV